MSYQSINISHFYELVQNNKKFSFTKINHGFWDRIIDKRKSKSEFFFNKDVYQKIYIRTKFRLPKKYFYFGVDVGGHEILGYKDLKSTRIKSIISVDQDRVKKIKNIIKKFLPPEYLPYNGHIFRHSAIDNTLIDFLSLFKNYDVITVGHHRLKSLNTLFQFRSFNHITIHSTQAWKTKDRVQSILFNKIKSLDNPVVFLQGAYVATYLIFNLHGEATLLDMGRALDVFYPEVNTQSWFYFLNLEQYYREYWT